MVRAVVKELKTIPGLFEESHGVTGNRFILEDGISTLDYYGGDPEKNMELLNRKILKGDPIWLTNERAGFTRKSAVIKWPFAEATFEKTPHKPKFAE